MPLGGQKFPRYAEVSPNPRPVRGGNAWEGRPPEIGPARMSICGWRRSTYG
jgi:hypothetical protein